MVLWLIVNVYCGSGYEGPAEHTPAYIGELKEVTIELFNQGTLVKPIMNGSPQPRLRPGETWTVVYCFELGSANGTDSAAVHRIPFRQVVRWPRERRGLGLADLINGYRLEVHCQHDRLAEHNMLGYPMDVGVSAVLSKSQERSGPGSHLEVAQNLVALLRYAQHAPGLAFHNLEVCPGDESLVCELIRGFQSRAKILHEYSRDEELKDLFNFYQSELGLIHEPDVNYWHRAYARGSTLMGAARVPTRGQYAARPSLSPAMSPTVTRRNRLELDRSQYPLARILGDVTNTLKKSAVKWKVPALFQKISNFQASKENNRINGTYGVLGSHHDIALTTLDRSLVSPPEVPRPLAPVLPPAPPQYLRPTYYNPNLVRQSVHRPVPSPTPSPAPIPAPLFSNSPTPHRRRPPRRRDYTEAPVTEMDQHDHEYEIARQNGFRRDNLSSDDYAEDVHTREGESRNDPVLSYRRVMPGERAPPYENEQDMGAMRQTSEGEYSHYSS